MSVHAALTCLMRTDELREPPKTVPAQSPRRSCARCGRSHQSDEKRRPRSRRRHRRTPAIVDTPMMPNNRLTRCRDAANRRRTRCCRSTTRTRRGSTSHAHRYQLLASKRRRTGDRPRSGRTRPAPSARARKCSDSVTRFTKRDAVADSQRHTRVPGMLVCEHHHDWTQTSYL